MLKPMATPAGHLERSEIPIPLKLSKGRNLDCERSLNCLVSKERSEIPISQSLNKELEA